MSMEWSTTKLAWNSMMPILYLILPYYLLLIKKISKHQSSSEFLSVLSKLPFKGRECCRQELDNKLDEDPFYICIESKNF